MRGQGHYLRVVVIEQGNLLTQQHGKERGTDCHADADAEAGAGCRLRVQRRALPQTEAHANRHRSSQGHRQDEHQRAEVQGDLVSCDINNP